jgi:hypothetical protein
VVSGFDNLHINDNWNFYVVNSIKVKMLFHYVMRAALVCVARLCHCLVEYLC